VTRQADPAGAGDRRRDPAGHLRMPAWRSRRKSWMVNPPGTAPCNGIGLIVWV
jgi:hypothetical protein